MKLEKDGQSNTKLTKAAWSACISLGASRNASNRTSKLLHELWCNASSNAPLFRQIASPWDNS